MTVRFRVIQAQVRSRGLLQEFIDGGWFWRYFVIRVLEATLAWMWVWTAVWECQFWHNGAPPVLCFPCQFVFITKCYVAFPCLTQRFMVVFCWKTTVLHGTLCSSLFCMPSERLQLGAACWSDAEQNELQTDMANTFFSFFLISKKNLNYKFKKKNKQECARVGYRRVWAMYSGWRLSSRGPGVFWKASPKQQVIPIWNLLQLIRGLASPSVGFI